MPNDIFHVRQLPLDALGLYLNSISDPTLGAFTFTGEDNAMTVTPATGVILVGSGDQAINIAPVLPRLITARNNGVGILFTHANPPVHTPGGLEATYLADLANFGIASLDAGHEYQFFSSVRVAAPTHPIATTPHALASTIMIETTHSLGIGLSASCQVILDDPLRPAGNTNFYLAVLDDNPLKGRVAHIAVGHNRYSHEVLTPLGDPEVRIACNLLYWLLRKI